MTVRIGEVIASYRRRRRQVHDLAPWTQDDLAVAIGTDKAHINRIERGRQMPARDTLIRICRALGVPWDDEQDLLVACGHAPELRLPSDEEMRTVIEAAAGLTDGLRYPALLYDIVGRFWYGNPIGLRFYASAAGIRAEALLAEGQGITVLEMMFLKDWGAGLERLVGGERHVLGLMSRTRKLAGIWQQCPEYLASIARLEQSERFREMWQASFTMEGEIDWVDHVTAPLSHPELGTLLLEMWPAHLAKDRRFFISHHVPADEGARAAPERLGGTDGRNRARARDA